MPLYAVRLIENKEAVGVFYVDAVSDLSHYVDECTDPGACEYKRLPHGGLYWGRPDCRVWAPIAAEGQDIINPERDVPEESCYWGDVLYGDAPWKPIIKPLPPAPDRA